MHFHEIDSDYLLLPDTHQVGITRIGNNNLIVTIQNHQWIHAHVKYGTDKYLSLFLIINRGEGQNAAVNAVGAAGEVRS